MVVLSHTLAGMGEQRRGVQQIDYAEAGQMLRDGRTRKEVADRFGVTPAAIATAILRGNIEADPVRAQTRAVPWSPIAPQHREKYLVRMLRAAHRRDAGLTNAPVMEAQLNTFMASMERDGWVVDYDPDSEDGFVRVPRREGIDLGLVREPGA